MDTTISFHEEAPNSRKPVNTGVDLIAYDAWGRPETHPVLYDRFLIGSANSNAPPDILVEERHDKEVRVWLRWSEGRLFVSNESMHLQLMVNGQATTHRELFDGDSFSLGVQRFRVVGLRSPVATLEGYTHPHQGQRWLLETGRNTVGRKGQRANHVELDDPTVSRAHATLVVTEYGLTLEAETQSSQSKVNGQPVQPGQPWTLADSDLIQLGRQAFRLRLLATPEGAVKGVPVQAAVLAVRILCQAPLLQRPKLYLEGYNAVWSVPKPQDVQLLPHDGEMLVYVNLGPAQGLVDPLVEFAWAQRARWQELGMAERELQLAMSLHLATADQQPPQANFASIKRALKVAEALSLAAPPQGAALTISRPAWEASQRVTTAQRIGCTCLAGDLTPIEAYHVDRV